MWNGLATALSLAPPYHAKPFVQSTFIDPNKGARLDLWTSLYSSLAMAGLNLIFDHAIWPTLYAILSSRIRARIPLLHSMCPPFGDLPTSAVRVPQLQLLLLLLPME